MARTGVVSLPPRGRVAIPKALAGALILIIVVGILGVTGVLAQVRQYIPGRKESTPSFQTATVSRGNVEVSVIATGPVAAVNELPLTFKTSGKLAGLKVAVGEHVQKGQVLATLDTTDLKTALDQAKANLVQAQANLAKLEDGATAAQKQVAQASVDSAKTAASNAQANVTETKASSAKDVAAAKASVQIAQTGVTTAQAALAAAKDQAQKGLAADQTAVANAQKNLQSVKATVAANGPVLQQQLQQAKDSLWSQQISRDAICGRSKGADCQAANASVAAAETNVNSTAAQIAQSQQQGAQQIAQAQAQLDQAQAQLANDQAKFNASIQSAQNQVKQAEAQLASAQIGVSQAEAKATASVQSAQAQADQAVGALKSAQADYNQVIAPPTQADLDAAKAQVANAQAALEAAQANLDAATLTAPFNGTVAAINGTVGQWVSGGPVNSTQNPLFTLVNLDNLQVTAQVNEADIGKVKVGDPVTFTVSAYPDKTLTGKVLSIQPVGTVVQNVVNYNVTCSIQSTKDATLYPGMTASATIIADREDNVLVVPNTALSFAQTAFRDGLVQFAGGRQVQRAGSGQGAGARPAGGQQSAGGRFAGRGSNAQGNSGGNFARGAGTFGQTNANRGIVMTLKNGQLVPIRVTLGITDGTNTEILSGVQAGESIVVGQSGAGSSLARSPNPGGPQPVAAFGRFR
jgi:HlyD family secretion protein